MVCTAARRSAARASSGVLDPSMVSAGTIASAHGSPNARRSFPSTSSRAGWTALRRSSSSTCAGTSGKPGDGHRGVPRGHLPGRDLPRPRRRPRRPRRVRRAGPPSPPRPRRVRRPHGGRGDRRRRCASWATTTSAAGSPRASGGCSTTWASAGAASRASWVGVLDGGIKAWAEAGHAARRPARLPRAARPAGLTLAGTWHGVIERDALKARLGTVTLLDARAAERYRGEVEPVDPVAGPHPDRDQRAVRREPRCRRADSRTAATSGAGMRSSGSSADGRRARSSCRAAAGPRRRHHSLAMRAAGLPDPILYVGSYSDWSRSGEPIATGPEPGAPPRRTSHREIGGTR